MAKRYKREEKHTQVQSERYLELRGIKFLHLTTNITRKIFCPRCQTSRFINLSVNGNVGFPDLLIFLPMETIIVDELKSKKGVLSKDQKEWRDYFRKCGIDYDNSRSFEALRTRVENKIKEINEMSKLEKLVTKYHKEQAEIRYLIDGNFCKKPGCDKPATQLAHRMCNSVMNKRLYGEKIVNHNINLVPVCDLDCNSHFNIGNKPNVEENIVKLIINRGDENIEAEEVTKIINE